MRPGPFAVLAQDVMRRVFGDKVEVTDWSLNPVCGTRLGFQPSCKATGRGDCINFVASENFQWYGAFGEGKAGEREGAGEGTCALSPCRRAH